MCRTRAVERDKHKNRHVGGFLWTLVTSGVRAEGRSFNIHLQNQQEHTWISVYLHDLREPNTHSSHLTDISGMQNAKKNPNVWAAEPFRRFVRVLPDLLLKTLKTLTRLKGSSVVLLQESST